MRGDKRNEWIGSCNWKSRCLRVGLPSGIAGSRNSSITRNLTLLFLGWAELSFHQVCFWVAEILPGTVDPFMLTQQPLGKSLGFKHKSPYWMSLVQFRSHVITKPMPWGMGCSGWSGWRMWEGLSQGWSEHLHLGYGESPNHGWFCFRHLRWEVHGTTERSGVQFGKLSLGLIRFEMPSSHHIVPLSHRLDMRHAFTWCLGDSHSLYCFYEYVILLFLEGYNWEV